MMRIGLAALLVLGAAFAVAGGSAPTVSAPAPAGIADTVRVSGAWVRAMPAVAKNSAGYLVIENRTDSDDALLGARVANVRVTELHEMVRDGDTMSMHRRDEIALPAHSTVKLAPGGLHLMLIDLQQPLQAGEKRDAVLVFRHAAEQKMVLEVRAP